MRAPTMPARAACMRSSLSTMDTASFASRIGRLAARVKAGSGAPDVADTAQAGEELLRLCEDWEEHPEDTHELRL